MNDKRNPKYNQSRYGRSQKYMERSRTPAFLSRRSGSCGRSERRMKYTLIYANNFIVICIIRTEGKITRQREGKRSDGK